MAKNLKGAGGHRDKYAKVGWIVWGQGDTDGTSFASLAQKYGWCSAEHPNQESKNFDPDTDWALVIVCSENELEGAAKTTDGILGWTPLAQFNKDTSPGFEDEGGEGEDEDSDEDSDEDGDDEEDDDEEDEDEDEESEEEDEDGDEEDGDEEDEEEEDEEDSDE